MRARKWGEGGPIADEFDCFNGAAPVRARKYGEVVNMPAGAKMLQRGRACEGAEICLPHRN